MAKKPETAAPETPNAAPPRLPYMKRVHVEPCPQNPEHHTRIYSTDGKTRHCCCDDCGLTWKQSGAFADPLRDYCDSLAKMFEDAEPVQIEEGGRPTILLDLSDARAIVTKFRELLGVSKNKD